ncbi:DUF551 domain-containing protein [Salmonella enterica]|uniref:DUF551 domain-containing protein n=1 Tax=Salmonella enterica subsp. enterica serovar Saintpaul TaxID=90105 RepID=A0A1S0ZHQ4_SALET|nr:hypothetical protein [Salmonella enterica]EAT6876041.1 DUF551 domain-containing protein [Salmonella enterica]EAW8399534.1 DUF551 domain-containing protein [Salmonella enterica]EBN8214010.1 DUF551 domain-containing protein [Salmonella enterica]EBP0539487.1 DUF551 domain-containing protein [Salmonella enterica]EGK6773902.1 DUF551 domain-containing protein [Salmonella enterica]
MTTITREQLHERARRKVKELEFAITQSAFTSIRDGLEEELELARIALAALEVAPVGEVSEKRHGLVMDGTVDLGGKSTYRIIKGEKAMKRLPLGTKFYIVPPVPLDNEFIPKNLDRALGVVGVALPESKEEFNFQIERWIQRLIDRVIRYADEFKEQPAPVVPDEKRDDDGSVTSDFDHGWNACRAAMLQGVEQPQNARQNIPENIPDGNSPAIPDDWVMVPKEPTQAMIKAWLSEVANFRGHAAGYKAALAAAPQREVK